MLGLFSAITPPWPTACFPAKTNESGIPASAANASTQAATAGDCSRTTVRMVSSDTPCHALECAATDALPCADRFATKHSCAQAPDAWTSSKADAPTPTATIRCAALIGPPSNDYWLRCQVDPSDHPSAARRIIKMDPPNGSRGLTASLCQAAPMPGAT